MSWFSQWSNPQKGYQDAQKELENYYNQGQGYQQPYNEQGQAQYPRMQRYMDALEHPEKLYNEWASGYSESPAAKQAEAMAQEHGLNAASSLGLMGSSPALQAIQAGTSGIVQQDRQSYLDDLMEKYKTGIGLTQGVYNTGATTAGQMNQNAQNMGQNSAGFKYGEKSSQGGLFSNLVGAGGSILGGIAGSVGGPIGAAAGAAIGNRLFSPHGSYSPGSGMPPYR